MKTATAIATATAMTSENSQLADEGDDSLDSMTVSGMDYFVHADDEHIAREKRKARELRASQWWKNELAKGVCHYCHRRFRPSELTMDHIVPIIRGGFTKKGNVVACCKECNNEKKYLLPQEWKNKDKEGVLK